MERVFTQLHAGAIAVTSTRRLSRYVLEQYAAYKQAQGHNAWATAQAFTWDQWLASLWQRAATGGAGKHRLLLDDQQEQALWESIVRRSLGGDDRYALLQVPGTARAVRETWALLHDWQISLAEIERSHLEDSRIFCRWARELERILDQRDWITQSQLAPTLASAEEQLPPSSQLLLLGFDQLTPGRQRLIEVWRQAGFDIERFDPVQLDSDACRTAYIDRRQEILAIAYWARDLLEQGEPGPIGIIIDDLPRWRNKVERVFDQVLHPAHSLSADGDYAGAYHVSLGRPLADYPLVDAAILLLRFMSGSRPSVDITRLLHAPFVGGYAAERWARARLDLSLRSLGWARVSLSGLLSQCERNRLEVSRLCEILHQAQEFEIPHRQSPSNWARTWVEWLRVFGWPGEHDQNSDEYQTVIAWRDLLSQFARLTMITPEVGLSEALARLSYLAQKRIFQPQNNVVPVQIMGALESAGMTFSHCWLSGMSDDLWPPPPRPDPFIPYALQKRAGLPRATAEGAFDFYREMSVRLLHSAHQVVVSYPARRDEQDLGLSALFSHLPERTPASIDVELAQRIGQQPLLELILDRAGPRLDITRPHRGGAGIFRDQAMCPFRAFAHHRLAARAVPFVDIGLDAAERGTLAHLCMANLWHRLQTQQRLLSLSMADIEQILEDSVRDAVAKVSSRQPAGFGPRFLQLEQQRLISLLREWLQVERERKDFVVAEIEYGVETRFAGIDLSFRIDRIDHGASGCIIIDYKTGRDVNINHWSGERPDDPQLPLYVLSLQTPVEAVAFAQLRHRNCSYMGVSQGAGFAAGVDRDQDLQQLKHDWERALTGIADEFKAGRADVSPKSRAACKVCDVMALCRVFETPGREVVDG